MVLSNAQAFFNREYPLVKLFQYGDDEFLIYDAKPHFAFVLSAEELLVLLDFLQGQTKEEILKAHKNQEDVISLWENFNNLKNAGVFIKGPVSEIAPVDIHRIKEQIKYFSENIMLRKFCLQVTENCNFRCKYCKRTLAADHADTTLSEVDAYRGIDYYFNKYTTLFAKLPSAKKELLLEILPPRLSFYGGEPFLNFELMKKCTDYFKSLPWENYSIPVNVLGITANANLSIMNDEIISFLVKHRVTLFASLDGPQEEHNKSRVLENGKGTFDLVFRNLMKLKEADPVYYKEKVSIFGVVTTEHDYTKCVEFTKNLGVFNTSHFPADYSGVFVANVEAQQRFYQNALTSNLAEFKKMLSFLPTDLDGEIDKVQNLFSFAKLKYDNPHGNNLLNILLTCPMGFDNLMLAANGDYLICHKVLGSMPIGNAATGLDYDRLAELFQKYNEAVNNPECKSCWSVRFCSICAATRMKQDDFVNPTKKECEVLRLRTSYDFSCFIHLAINEPQLLERIFTHRNDPKCFIGVIDINDFK